MKFATHVRYDIEECESQYGNKIFRILETLQYYKWWNNKPKHTMAGYVSEDSYGERLLEFATLENAREWIALEEGGVEEFKRVKLHEVK